MTSQAISVVIPVFNGMRFLAQTVASVEAQTHASVELVLVDGGSTDGSREWIDRYARSHTCVTDYLPAGTPAARTWTRASVLANGAFTVLLCQDDLLYPHALEDQVRVLDEFPDAVMVSARRDIIDGSGTVIAKSRGAQGASRGVHRGDDLIRLAYRRATNIFGEPLAVLFRTRALQGHLPWRDTHPFMLDMEMYCRVITGHTAVISHNTVGAFRVSSDSWSTRLVTEQTRQFRAWQDSVSQSLVPAPTPVTQAEAAWNRGVQALLRRVAYLWLGARSRM